MKRQPYYQVWLNELLGDVHELPAVNHPRPYWSQRHASPLSEPSALHVVVEQVQALLERFQRDHYFSQQFGYACIDGDVAGATSTTQELQIRVGKGQLLDAPSQDWTTDDLCDFIEIHHDLCSRPTSGAYHSFGECGWHPHTYAVAPGQSVYRWRLNRLLDATGLHLRLAEQGEDQGRIVRASSAGADAIIEQTIESAGADEEELIAHAVALFRSRSGGRHEMRSAIVALAGVLENRRSVVKDLLTKDEEGRLFEIANRYGLRHRNAEQTEEYGEEFLEWIFFSYLNTVNLLNRLMGERP